MNVVVTGANGFIGLHTVKGLLKRGYRVVAIDLKDDRLLEEIPGDRHLTIVLEDIVSKDFANWVMEGDVVIHLAAVATFSETDKRPVVAVETNVLGTFNVLQCCVERKAEKLIFSSTGSVYSSKADVPIREDAPREPPNLYGLTKKMAEDFITTYGHRMPYIILRYGYVYGAGKDWGAVGSFLKLLRANQQPTIYGGNQTNDFTYVKDIVEANVLAVETQFTNKIFNIGTGRAVSIRDVCDVCRKALDSKIEPKMLPPRTVDYPVFVYDITKARTLLKYEPQWNIYDGVNDMVSETTISPY